MNIQYFVQEKGTSPHPAGKTTGDQKNPLMNNTHVVLVDEADKAVGTMDKLEAHRQGRLHRAFSIFILNSKGEMLLQQRALGKYHSGGLWTNACCSHPMPDESVEAAALRRLREEMGFACPLHRLFAFTYRSQLDNGLIEHEYDHVLLGTYDGVISPAPEEVQDYRYLAVPEIEALLEAAPATFTSWFRLVFHRVAEHLRNSTHTTL